MVFRCFAEKRPAYDVAGKGLERELRELLGLRGHPQRKLDFFTGHFLISSFPGIRGETGPISLFRFRSNLATVGFSLL